MDHAAVTRRPDADAPAVTAALPGLYGVFLPGYCAPLRWDARGGPPSTSPRWPLAEQATQPRNLLTQPPCPRLSPPRRCRHPEFSSSLTSSLGSDSTIFFAAFYTFATAARRCTWNLEPSLLPHHGSAARRAAAVSTPLPGPTAARLLLRATSVGRATHLYLAWPHRDELPTFTLPGLVNLSTRPHTSSSLKDCCWRVG